MDNQKAEKSEELVFGNENDTGYYNQLHEAARHYDTKLWAIPGVSFFYRQRFLMNLILMRFLP